MAIKNLSELDDFVGFVVLSAPNKFPKLGPFSGDPIADVERAFEDINLALPLVQKRIKDSEQLDELRRLLEASRAAYLAGEKVRGAHLLQDFQDIVFPDRFKSEGAKVIS